MPTRIHEKYAWVVFLIIGVLLIIGGIPHMFGYNTDPTLVEAISGQTTDELKDSYPKIFNLYDFYFRGGGLSDVGFGFLIVVISLTAYRTGQKWAWYTFLIIPLYFLVWIGLSIHLPAIAKSMLLPPLLSIIVFSLIGLLAPVRKFFNKTINS